MTMDCASSSVIFWEKMCKNHAWIRPRTEIKVNIRAVDFWNKSGGGPCPDFRIKNCIDRPILRGLVGQVY